MLNRVLRLFSLFPLVALSFAIAFAQTAPQRSNSSAAKQDSTAATPAGTLGPNEGTPLDSPGANASDLRSEKQQSFMQNRKSPDALSPAAHRFHAVLQKEKIPVISRSPATSAGLAVSFSSATTASWTPIGPQPINDILPRNPYRAVGGRVTSIAVDLSDDPSGNTVYVGAAYGGIWKSTNAQSSSPTFTPLTDSQRTLSVGTIALDPSTHPATIYVGTGEPNGSDSYYGAGIMKSVDGGASWTLATSATVGTQTPSFLGLVFYKIVVDPTSPQTVLAAAGFDGSHDFGLNSKIAPPGIYRSADAGQTWSLVADYIDSSNHVFPSTDLLFEPQSQAFFAAFQNAGFVVSTDHGQHWTVLPSPFASASTPLTGNFARASMTTRGGVIWALIANANRVPATPTPCSAGLTQCDTGMVQSTDGGHTWTPVALPVCSPSVALCDPTDPLYGGNNQGLYDQDLAAPGNSTELVIGGIDVWATSAPNGLNTTWTNLTHAYSSGAFGIAVHPDQHAIGVIDAAHWYIGNDGGVWSTGDSGNTWTDLNQSIGAIQFYSVSADAVSSGVYFGGSQDNGTSKSGDPLAPLAWTSILPGDGGFTAASALQTSAGTVDRYFAENPFEILHSDSAGSVDSQGNPSFMPVFINPQTENHAFYVPYELVPTDNSQMVLGAQSVWRGPSAPASAGAGWAPISMQLTNFYIQALAVAPTSAAVIYAVTTENSPSCCSGKVWKTSDAQDGLPIWADLSSSFGQAITKGPVLPLGAVAIHPTDPNTVYVGMMGFGSGHVFKTADGGNTWLDITGTLPDAPVNWILIDPQAPNNVYVASDVGVFVITDGGAGGTNESWQQLGTGLPDTTVLQLNFTNAGARLIVAATHGRGAWTIPPLSIGAGVVTLVPNPLAFGNQTVNTSTTKPVTLTNNTPSALTVTGISFGGAAPADYSETDNCTTTPVPVGQICTINVAFKPSQVGERDAVLTINDSAGSQTANVTGAGTLAGGNFTLTLTQVGNGQGTVTSNPAGINCPAGACSASFAQGTSVTLTAAANSGSIFAGWIGGGCGGTGTCTVVMNANVLVTATFTLLGTGSTQIAFVHVDGDCSNLATCAMSLKAIDPQNPGQQIPIISFSAGVLVDPPVWSKDFASLAFASTVNDDHSLEMPRSVFAANADGSNLREITGLGIIGQYAGPTATVQGNVVPPVIHVTSVILAPGQLIACPNPPTNITQPCELPDGTYLVPPIGMINCSVTTKGGPTTVCSTTDGSYSLVANVPVLSSWVRGFSLVNYNDPFHNVRTYVPTIGATSIILQAGQLTQATINTQPKFAESTQPSWSRDGSELIATATIWDTETQTQVAQSGFVLYSVDGKPLGNIPLPPGCFVGLCDVSGADWSPTDNRITFALIEVSLAGQITTGVATMNPDGTNFQWVIQVPQIVNPFVTTITVVQQARWSPDGNRIAFSVETVTALGVIVSHDLYVVSANGTSPIQLTHNQSGQIIQGFSWSPDSSTLAFDISNTAQLSFGAGFPIPEPTSADIFTIRADGTGPVKLTADGRSFGPTWRGVPLLPATSVSPTSLRFGTQSLRTTSPAQTLTLTNVGTGALAITGITIIGTGGGDFSQINSCGNLVAAGASCNITVAFSPTVPGPRTASINIADNSASSPQTVPLSGTGVVATGDFDGDGKADVAVWRPSTGTWFIIGGNPGSFIVQQWGTQGDVPVPGDYDGDGKTDFAVWRPSTGTWFIIPSSNPSAPIVQQWGTQGDIPVPGDYDGDGQADIAVFRPSTGTWFIIPSGNPSALIIQQWGTQGDIPVPGDYDGDGKTDFAVFRPSNGVWYIIPSSNPGFPIVQQWGTQGDVPVPGDYDGDGKTDFAVWRPSSGTWFIIPTSNPGAPIIQQWGTSGDIPVPVDYDGDGKTDIAVWRPSNGVWYIISSSTPTNFTFTQWGTNGDAPVQKPIGQ